MADQEPVEGYDPEQLDKKAAAVEEAVAVGLELAAASVASDIGQQFVAGPADAVTVPGVWAQIVEGRIAPLISDIIYDTAETIRLGIANAGERLYAGEAIVPTEVRDPRPIDNVTAEGLLSHATNRMNDIGNDLWLNIQQTLAEGVAQGESIPELAARVRDAAPMTEARARMIARNEVISASNASSLAQARSAGVPLNKTWLAVLDLRTRPSHAAAEGLTVPLDEPFMIGEPVAYPLDFPGDPSGPPSEVYGCRCTLAYELLRTPPDIITVSSIHLFTCREGNSKTGKVLHKGPCVGWKHGLPETDPRHPKNVPPKKPRVSKPRARKAPYLTQQQAQQMQDRMLEGDPWTDGQKHALYEYAGNMFKPMNDVLRGAAKPEDREAYYGLPPGGLQQLIDDAMAGMRPTTEPLTVTRALGWDAFGLGDVRLRDIADAAEGLKGKTFEDQGFLSTTTKREPPLSTIGNATLKLEVPAGTPAAYIRSLSDRPEESEIILGPGTPFQVTDVQRTPKGMVVSGRVVPRASSPEVAAAVHLFTCTGEDGKPIHPGPCVGWKRTLPETDPRHPKNSPPKRARKKAPRKNGPDDKVRAARERQARIDKAREAGNGLAAKLEASWDDGDAEATAQLRSQLDKQAEEAGVRLFGEPDTLVPFDPRLHDAGEQRVRAGQLVEAIAPGVAWAEEPNVTLKAAPVYVPTAGEIERAAAQKQATVMGPESARDRSPSEIFRDIGLGDADAGDFADALDGMSPEEMDQLGQELGFDIANEDPAGKADFLSTMAESRAQHARTLEAPDGSRLGQGAISEVPQRLTPDQAQALQDVSAPPLAPEQYEAIRDYSKSGYTSMNALLRGGPASKLPAPEDEARYRDEIEAIRSAMQPWPQATTVDRLVRPDAFGIDIDDPQTAEKLAALNGSTFQDQGFLSSTVGELPKIGDPRSALLHIEVPKGTPAAYIQRVSEGGYKGGEEELLLDAGLTYEITGVTTRLDDAGDPIHEVFMRVVPSPPTTAALSGGDLVRFNQLHPRTHGRFGHKFEQYLGDDEHVTRFAEAPVGEHSEKQMPMARIDTPDGPRIRIGAVDDAEQWQAGGHDHDRIGEIDARVAEIEDLFDSGYDGPDADALDRERDTLEQERDRLEEPEDTVQLAPAELDRARADVAAGVAQAQEWAQQDHAAWAGQRALDKAESAQLLRVPMDQRTPEQVVRLAELSDKFIFDPDGSLDVSGEFTGERGGILHWNVLGDDNGAWTLHVGVVGDEDDSGEYQDSATFGPEGAQRLLGMWSELAAEPTTAAAHLFTCINHMHVGLCTAKDPHFEKLHPRDHGKFAKKAGGPSGLVGRLLAAVRGKRGGEDTEDELDDGPPPSEPLSPKIAKAREEFQRRAKAAATEAQALAAAPVSFDYDIKEENGKAKFRGRGRLHGTKTTPERAAALEAYQSTDDVFRLGRFLRGLLPGQRKDKPGVIPDEVDGRPLEEMEDLQKMADTIDGVIDESPLKEDVVVYRVVEHGAELFGRDWDIPASMEVGPKDIDKVRQLIRWKQQGWRPDMSGAEFTEHGFMSTSASDQWVKKWASRWERSGASEPVMLRMLVPKGTKGVQLSEVGEMEILLGRGHRWQIVEDHGVGADGLRHLDLMLVDE